MAIAIARAAIVSPHLPGLNQALQRVVWNFVRESRGFEAITIAWASMDFLQGNTSAEMLESCIAWAQNNPHTIH